MPKSFNENFTLDKKKIDSIIERYEKMKNYGGIKKNISEKVSKSLFDVCTFNTGSVFKKDGHFHVTFDCTNGTILQFTDKPYDDVKNLYRQYLNLNKNKDLIHPHDSIPNGVFYLDRSNEINIIKIYVHRINQGKYYITCSLNYNDTSDTFLGISKDKLDNLKDPVLFGAGVFFLDSKFFLDSNTIIDDINANIKTNLSGEVLEKLMTGEWQIGFISDNLGLEDRNNDEFYQSQIKDDINQSNNRCFKNKVKVKLCDGSIVNKHIIHWNKEDNYFCITNNIFWDQFDKFVKKKENI